MFIHIKGCFTILGKIYSNFSDDVVSFTVELEEVKNINIKIHLKEGFIETYYKIEAPDDILEILEGGVDADNLSPELKQKILKLSSPLNIGTRRALSVIKYNLNQERLDESLFSVKDKFWSKDGIKWMSFPMFVHFKFINMIQFQK